VVANVTYSAEYHRASPHIGQTYILAKSFQKILAMNYLPLELFGQHLIQLRKAKGWSQEKLALESGLARSYIGGIERGQRNLALINICVLAETLDVPPSEMLNFLPSTNIRKKSSSMAEK
jgi:DNA-binding XRE family transcriptional regulator